MMSSVRELHEQQIEEFKQLESDLTRLRSELDRRTQLMELVVAERDELRSRIDRISQFLQDNEEYFINATTEGEIAT